MTFFRILLWKLAVKNIYKISCPTFATYKNLSKFEFLREKLCVLNDPILNIGEIQKIKNKKVIVNEDINQIISKKVSLISRKIHKTKKLPFYLNCILKF